MSTLNLFPARVAIGVVQENGTVLMTPEFFRALTDVLQRVGGTAGADGVDLELLANNTQPPAVDFGQFYDMLAAVQGGEQNNAELQKRVSDLEVLAGYADPFRVNWERPGAIGSLTAASGAFTTLTASSTVTLSPANANVTISPTGTGTVTFAPATAGTINNMSIGATTRASGAFTTLDANAAVGLSPANANVTISPTGTGTVTISPATQGAINRMTVGATVAASGAFTTLIAANGFGCNGKSAQTPVALGAAATDLASVINLANLMRAALINNGIGS